MKTSTLSASRLLRSLAFLPAISLFAISCGQESIQPQTESAVEASAKAVEDLPVEGLNGALKIAGIEYYFKNVDGKITYYDVQGNIVDIDEDAAQVEGIRMFPRKGQKIAAKSGMLKYIKENQNDLKYYIGGVEVTQSEAEQTIQDSGDNGVKITKDAAGKPAIEITMNAVKRAMMPQVGPIVMDNGSTFMVSPTLIDANKNDDNPTYKKKMLVLNIAEQQNKPTLFYIDNTNVSVKEIHYLLNANPEAGMSVKENVDGSKALLLTSTSKNMSDDDLQTIYSNLFETYKK